MVLNVTNGDYFNGYFCKKYKERAVPFREAMMMGKACPKVFCDEFIAVRASLLGISQQQYRKNAKEIINLRADKDNYSRLGLWFGYDTFCQLNLLTLLAYLEQINYVGEITLNIIDDESFCVLKSGIRVALGEYKDIYENVLVKRIPAAETGVISKEAIELYFDYLSPDGVLAKAIKSNRDMDKDKLVGFIMSISKQYGLSELQAMELIRKYRK